MQHHAKAIVFGYRCRNSLFTVTHDKFTQCTDVFHNRWLTQGCSMWSTVVFGCRYKKEVYSTSVYFLKLKNVLFLYDKYLANLYV